MENVNPYLYIRKCLLGKWKMTILNHIHHYGAIRFNETRKTLPISEKVLAEQLKTAEKDIKTNKRTVSKKEKDLKSQKEQFNELFEKEQSLMGERSKLIENNLTVIVDVLQESLSEGAPCPVCGSKAHPYCEDSKATNSNECFENEEKVTDIAKKLKEIIKQLETTTKEKNNHSVQINSLTNEIKELKNKLSEAMNTLETGFKQLEDLILPWHAEKFELSEIDDICQELNTRSNEYRNTQIKVEKLETSISEKEATLNTSNATLMDKENQYQEHENNFNKTVEALAELKKKRTDYLQKVLPPGYMKKISLTRRV